MVDLVVVDEVEGALRDRVPLLPGGRCWVGAEVEGAVLHQIVVGGLAIGEVLVEK